MIKNNGGFLSPKRRRLGLAEKSLQGRIQARIKTVLILIFFVNWTHITM